MTRLLKKLPFYTQDWFQFILFLIRHFIMDKCQQRAASLTYTTLLSIVPFLTVLLVMLSAIPALESVREQIYEVIYSNLMPSSSTQISGYIDNFTEKSTNLTTMGVLALFVTTIMTLRTIETTFNQIWRVKDNASRIKRILRYWTMITLGPIILGIVFLASSAVSAVSLYTQQMLGDTIDFSLWLQLIPYCLTAMGFIGMYWFIPRVNVPIKNAIIAGVIITLLFESLKTIFGGVMSNFTSYEAIYGAFAALPIFLLWIYLSWNLILLGVEISYTLTIFDTKTTSTEHPLIGMLSMLNVLHNNHKQGLSVDEQTLKEAIGRRQLPDWYQYVKCLEDNNLISMTEDKHFILKRDLSTISLWDFYQLSPYPLPIKTELNHMQAHINDQSRWQINLLNQLSRTKQNVQQDLSETLSALFDTPSANNKNGHNLNNPSPNSSNDINNTA